MEIVRGRFNWVELVTTDRKAARDFYVRVMGWKVEEQRMPSGDPYAVLLAGGAGVGGIFPVTEAQRDAGMRTGWVGYVTTLDVDGDARRLVALGGQVHRAPEDIPRVGRIVPVSDPLGAGFLLMHPKPPADEPERRLPTGPGSVGWAELITPDPKGAWAFYSELFAWKSERVTPMGPAGDYRVFSTGADPGGGIMKGPDPHWLYYFRVESAGAAVQRVKDAGGKVDGTPQQVPTGDWVVRATDPMGGVFALTSRAP